MVTSAARVHDMTTSALGLLSEPDGLAARAIAAQGVVLETLRRTVTIKLAPAAEGVPDLIPFDSAARKALELTFREALRLGHNYVGTEHILLALLELEEGAGRAHRAGDRQEGGRGDCRCCIGGRGCVP